MQLLTCLKLRVLRSIVAHMDKKMKHCRPEGGQHRDLVACAGPAHGHLQRGLDGGHLCPGVSPRLRPRHRAGQKAGWG